MRSPFRIFCWRRPFLPALKRRLDELAAGPARRVTLVVPHRRPWRHLLDMYAKDGGGARVLPQVMTMVEVFSAWMAVDDAAPVRTANDLDRVAVLRKCVGVLAAAEKEAAAEKGAGPAGRLAGMDVAAFLPWGLRLADVLEEIFALNRPPADIPDPHPTLPRAAADILRVLGRLAAAYAAALKKSRWTTPRLTARRAAELADTPPPRLAPGPDHAVVFAGFHHLDGVEDAVMRALWERGAEICLHTDPALAGPAAADHWACAEHRAWRERWKADAILDDASPADEEDRRPAISFFAGHDVHSQIIRIREELERPEPTAGEDGPSVCIVPCSSELLMPVLHHLPDKAVNVSMGYPMELAPLSRLVDGILRLAESRAGNGAFLWRDLRDVLQHPYLRMLRDDDSSSLGDALIKADRTLRSSGRHILPADLRKECPSPILGEILDHLDGVSAAKCTADLAAALDAFCAFLLVQGEKIWARHPLDAEAMYRLHQRVLPVLRDNAMKEEELPGPVLHGIARELLAREKIPFEADPVTGLQILGMLETRLLHFDRVIILDATDDILPGGTGQDPLLPDSLRAGLGLPSASQRRESILAHAFWRLCASADKVLVSWQEGTSRSAIFDARKSRSRFVERLIWEEERQSRRLLAPADGIGITVDSVRPFHHGVPFLERTPALREAMNRLLSSKPLSPTWLDRYLQCPLAFVRSHLCELRPPAEINEGDDAPAVGELLHEVLRRALKPFCGKNLATVLDDVEKAKRAAADAEGDAEKAEKAKAAEDRFNEIEKDVIGIFNDLVENMSFDDRGEKRKMAEILPPASFAMLRAAGPARLRDCLKELVKHADNRVVKELEQELEADLSNGEDADFPCRIKGRLDRMDSIDGRLVVLDYKTGGVKYLLPKAKRLDDGISKRFQAWRDRPENFPAEEADAILGDVRDALPSLQLPCYILLARAKEMDVVDAALVELADKGKEHFLFRASGKKDEAVGDPAQEDARRERLLGDCRDAIRFVVAHMRHAPAFTGVRSRACDWCDFRSLC